MTERGNAIIILWDFSAPNAPPPTTIYYLNDREEGRYNLCRILAPFPRCPPLTPQYLTILMTERWGRHYLL